MQRGRILMAGIIFRRCQLSMLLGNALSARAGCTRFKSGGWSADSGPNKFAIRGALFDFLTEACVVIAKICDN
jgi:hypothetical protein